MSKEIERKFILKGEIPKEFNVLLKIKQAYLMLDGNKQLRVRIINDGSKTYAILTYKVHNTSSLRDEYEYEINLNEALELYATSDIKIEKHRYLKSAYNTDIIYFIDDYIPSGLLLKTVEIEYPSEDTSWLPENILGLEVTSDDYFSNINLCKLKQD